MNISFSGLNIPSKISRHLALIAFILAVVFNGWLLWQSSADWSDQPLAPERISAKQLRVNETQRTKLLDNLNRYRQASVPSGNSNVVFTP